MRNWSRFVSLGLFSAVTALAVHGCVAERAPGAAEETSAEESSPTGAAALALKPSFAYQERAGRAEGHLKAIEARLDKVTSTKHATAKDAEELDNAILAYAQEMRDAFDTAKSDAEEASKTKGAKGNVDSLQSFEDTTKKHEQRTKNVQARLEAIDQQIKKGEIKVDQPRPGGPLGRELQDADASSTCEGDISVGEQAEPLVAAGCVTLCAARNWAACATCVVGAGAAAAEAWNSFKSCWNSCSCGWTSPFCCVKKAGCLSVFIAKLG